MKEFLLIKFLTKIQSFNFFKKCAQNEQFTKYIRGTNGNFPGKIFISCFSRFPWNPKSPGKLPTLIRKKAKHKWLFIYSKSKQNFKRGISIFQKSPKNNGWREEANEGGTGKLLRRSFWGVFFDGRGGGLEFIENGYYWKSTTELNDIWILGYFQANYCPWPWDLNIFDIINQIVWHFY